MLSPPLLNTGEGSPLGMLSPTANVGGGPHCGMLSPPIVNTEEGSPLGMLSPTANMGGGPRWEMFSPPHSCPIVNTGGGS